MSKFIFLYNLTKRRIDDNYLLIRVGDYEYINKSSKDKYKKYKSLIEENLTIENKYKLYGICDLYNRIHLALDEEYYTVEIVKEQIQNKVSSVNIELITLGTSKQPITFIFTYMNYSKDIFCYTKSFAVKLLTHID